VSLSDNYSHAMEALHVAGLERYPALYQELDALTRDPGDWSKISVPITEAALKIAVEKVEKTAESLHSKARESLEGRAAKQQLDTTWQEYRAAAKQADATAEKRAVLRERTLALKKDAQKNHMVTQEERVLDQGLGAASLELRAAKGREQRAKQQFETARAAAESRGLDPAAIIAGVELRELKAALRHAEQRREMPKQARENMQAQVARNEPAACERLQVDVDAQQVTHAHRPSR
jgi:hypothetical protein